MAAPPDPLSRTAVQRAQAGDARARERLLSALEPILRSYFASRIGAGPDADDLVQNTLVRLHTSLEDVEKPGRLKGFALKAALFELQDFYRGRYSMKERLYAPDEAPPGAKASADDAPAADRIDAAKALAALSPKARRIIELRALGYRYKEIARMIDSTEAAIKMQVKRAFEAMRDALGALLAVLLSGAALLSGGA